MFPGLTADICIPAARMRITKNSSVIYLQSLLPVIQAIFMYYQKKVVRKSFYQKAIDLFQSDCVSAEGNRHIDTNYNDDTYGLQVPLHI